MNQFFKQLKKEAQEIRLDAREREVMRLALEEAMRSHHLVKSPVHITPSPLLFFSHRLISSFAFVLVLAVIGSGTAYAAEAALPGDILYPLKVSVNEPVRAALAASPESKAAIYARFAERRMEEAQVLAARGTLTTALRDELETHFNKHATDVEEVVGSVEREDPVAAADISASFSSSVSAHSAIIERLGEDGDDEENRQESRGLSRSLRDRGQRMARALSNVAAKAGRTPSLATQAPEGSATMAALSAPPDDSSDTDVVARIELTASTTLEEAERRLAAIRDSLDGTTSARTSEQISRIRELIKQFRNKNGRFSEKEKIERALEDSVKVKVFLEAQEKFPDHILLPAPEREDDEYEDKSNGPSKEYEVEDEDGEVK